MTPTDTDPLPRTESLAERVQAKLKLRHPPPPALAERLAAAAWASDPPCSPATALSDLGWAVVDLETTGINPAEAEIIEIGICVVEGDRVTKRHSSLVRPLRPIPPFVTGLTGIDGSMVEDAPSLSDALDQGIPLLRGRTIVAHNAAFDLGFLNRALASRGEEPLGNPVVCTKRLARRVRPDLHRRGLDALCQVYDIPIRPRHRAIGDAEATARLLVELVQLAIAQGVTTLGELLELLQSRPGPPIDFGRYAFGPAFLAHLPHRPGIYRMLDGDGRVIYVGKARDLHARVRSYFTGRARGKVAALRETLRDIEVIPTQSEVEALMREAAELSELRPPFNVQVQVHRRQFFLRMSARGRPRRIVATREPKAGEKFFGPYHLASGPRETAKRLREALALASRHGAHPDPERLLAGDGAAEVYAALEHELAGRRAKGDTAAADEVRTLLVTLRQVLASTAAPTSSFHRRDLVVRLPGVGVPRIFVLRDGLPARLLAGVDGPRSAARIATEIRALLDEEPPTPVAASSAELPILDAWLARHGAEAVLDLADIRDPAQLEARLDSLLRADPPPDGALFG